MKVETIEVACYTGTQLPCGIARATCLPRVLSTPGSGMSVLRALKKIEEVLLDAQPTDEDLMIALDDLRAMIAAVR